jgi:glycosyltransferase involved in cell wall biosynthesis
VLSVGTLIPTKGHDTLIGAIARLRDLGVPARLEIAGSEHRVAPGYRSELERLVEELELSEQIDFLGWVADMSEPYARSRVVGLASRPARDGIPAEGAPLALLEAMAHARPVVGPDEPGVAEIVAGSGTLVRDPTPAGFADALAPYLRDHERAVAAGEAGRARVREHFTIDRMVAELGHEYTGLIAAGRR